MAVGLFLQELINGHQKWRVRGRAFEPNLDKAVNLAVVHPGLHLPNLGLHCWLHELHLPAAAICDASQDTWALFGSHQTLARLYCTHRAAVCLVRHIQQLVSQTSIETCDGKWCTGLATFRRVWALYGSNLAPPASDWWVGQARLGGTTLCLCAPIENQ
jgi:hypothetical protein